MRELASQNVSDGFLRRATDQSKASVLVPDLTLHGLNNLDPAALVVDHTSDAVSHNKGKPPLLSTDDLVQPDAKLEHKKSEAPVLFRGMAPLLNPLNSLVWKILPISTSTYSDNPNIQPIMARNLARVSILGSLSLFSGFALRVGIQKSSSSISFGKSGNEPIVVAHGRLGYLSLSLSRQTSLWPLEMNSDPPPQHQLDWRCIRATLNSSSLEDYIGCKASTGTDDDGVNVSWNVYEVTKFSQLEKQGFPCPVGRFTWSETPGPSLQRAIATMIVPTLGTLILVIGANGFTAFALGSLVTGCGKSGAFYSRKWLHGFMIKTRTLLARYVKGLMDKQGRNNLLITSSKLFVSGAWQARGSALIGGPNFIHKLEHSAVNLIESFQHGGGDADDQLYEDRTFDRCFYIYGGLKQLQELRSFYEGRLKAVQQILDLSTQTEAITVVSKQGQKIKNKLEVNDNELKSSHDSSISKATDMDAESRSYLFHQPPPNWWTSSFSAHDLSSLYLRDLDVVWREFLWGGGIAGAFGEGMMHPVDTLKTRIQSQAILSGSQNQNSILQMMRTVWAADGLRGFYRGVTPGLTRSLATGATYFSFIESAKKWIKKSHPGLGGHWAHFLAGGVGDALGSFVYVPCEVIKQRMQFQGTNASWRSVINNANSVKLIGVAARPPPTPSSFANPFSWTQIDMKCWASITNTKDCVAEIFSSVTSYHFAVGPACCKVVVNIDEKCWPDLFPFNPFLPPFFKDQCARVIAGGRSPPAAKPAQTIGF
ncbi:hypothetical protein Nepgr_009444 [Nepenthes gracilis]|uniref:Uncharacterized protein n=1 Tax=Nepenthes gracilis TaxID=150966 RepID=A0AAD3XKC5_NEPGR|nr:hypothetical protein Nepgr_009444 [Nepenthes gracilis]